jgi:predicted TIM-barrel fold metal-dependent hydrolase
MSTIPVRDVALPPQTYYAEVLKVPCDYGVESPTTEEALRDKTLDVLKRRNILSLMSGPPDIVEAWRKAAPDNVLPAQWVDIVDANGNLTPIADLRALHAAGKLTAIAEVGVQYVGIMPDDPRLEPYFALAEELDVPIGLHTGPGPPGVTSFGAPDMRVVHPLAYQEVLARHPKLRLWLMHAGWPLADESIALMYLYPQVYVDTGVIDQILPRAGFYDFLKRLVDAGMINHIMYGSDNMLWPEGIESSIKAIEDAPFLNEQQKRAILHDNAARFLRLDQTATPQDH